MSIIGSFLTRARCSSSVADFASVVRLFDCLLERFKPVQTPCGDKEIMTLRC